MSETTLLLTAVCGLFLAATPPLRAADRMQPVALHPLEIPVGTAPGRLGDERSLGSLQQGRLGLGERRSSRSSPSRDIFAAMNAGPISRALTALLLALGLFTFPALAARHHAEDPPEIQGVPKVDNLPLIKVPTKGPGGDAFAVLLTGDGGWAETDRGLSKALVKGGVPVIGWNSLHYFLKRREPERATKDLERILRHFLSLWHKEKVILIGYSFGADVMPFLAARLPPDLAERVSLIALLGPSESADFRFHPREWLGKPSPEYRPVAPEIEKLAGKEILCFYGETEKATTLCLKLRAGLVKPLARPGTHIVGKNYGPIADAILAHGRTAPQ